jgi:hypothetical protein
MNKSILKYDIIILLMLFSLPLTLAAGTISPYPSTNPFGATLHYKLNGSTTESITGLFNGVIFGNPQYFNNDSAIANGQSLRFDGTGDYFNTTWSALHTANAWSICFWYKQDGAIGLANDMIYSDSGTGGETKTEFEMYEMNGQPHTSVDDDTHHQNEINNIGGTALYNQSWIHFCTVKEAGTAVRRQLFYFNGINQTYTVQKEEGLTLNRSLSYALGFGGRAKDSLNGNFYLQEILIWNTTQINLTTIRTLVNGSYETGVPPPTESDTLNASITFPATNTQFNTLLLNLNASVNSSYPFNVTLLINGTINQTKTDYPAGIDQPISFNLSFNDETQVTLNYTLLFISNETNENSTTKLFYIDNVNPQITWTIPNNANTTIIWNNLTSSIVVSDVNLFYVNYNLTFNGNNLFTASYPTLTGNQTLLLTNNINLSNYSGVINAQILACDGHTAKEISFKKVSKINNELMFDEIKIYPENKNDIRASDYSKKKDRYSFNFKTKQAKNIMSFIVESDSEIKILNGLTEYKGHLITGNKWIDFEMEGIKTINVNKLDDKKVQIIIETYYPISNFIFNSIGNLNCITEKRNFLSVNYTQSYSTAPFLNGGNTLLSLNVTYNSSYMDAIKGMITYNGVSYSGIATNKTTYYVLNYSVPVLISGNFNNTNLSFYWSFGYNSQTHIISNATQELYRPQIDSCTVFTSNWVNYTVKDEVGGTELNSSFNYQLIIKNGLYSSSLNGTRTPSSKFNFCNYPPFLNFTTDVFIYYNAIAAGYAARTYTISDFIVSNITQLIDLFLLSGGTVITIHTTDDADQNLQGTLIKVFSYNVGTGQDTLVAADETDDEGIIVESLIPNTQYYRFVFYRDGELVLNTTRFKLFSTTYKYILGKEADNPLSEWIDISQKTNSNLTYNNNTHLINFSWNYINGNLINQFCLIVEGNNTEWYNSCNSDKNDSLSYTINTFNISYIAIGKAITTTGNTYNLEILGIDTGISLRILLGTSATLFISLIIFLTLNLLVLGITGDPFGVKTGINIVIFMSMIVLIGLRLFSLLPIGWTGLMGILMVGFILLIVINKK